jgi:hypothetical protein
MADVLYGVTMEERGISKFVSMRLQKAEGPRRIEEVQAVGQGMPFVAEAVND